MRQELQYKEMGVETLQEWVLQTHTHVESEIQVKSILPIYPFFLSEMFL